MSKSKEAKMAEIYKKIRQLEEELKTIPNHEVSYPEGIRSKNPREREIWKELRALDDQLEELI